MKVLIILQGEGRGHMTQALATAKILQGDGHTIAGLIIGKVARRGIPPFFRLENTLIGSYRTPEFYYTRSKKKVSITKTILYNLSPAKIFSFICSLKYLKDVITENKPDIIINFFEPIFGIFTFFYRPKAKIISIAHQFMIFVKGSHYEQSKLSKRYLKLLAGVCMYKNDLTLALSVYPFDPPQKGFKVIPPILRKEVLNLNPYDEGYLLCYLVNSGLAPDLIKWSNLNNDVKIHLFLDDIQLMSGLTFNKNNIFFHKIDDKEFLKYLEGCAGLLSTAGFETICEASFLGKPVLMTPAHLEQELNAFEFSLLNMGIVSKTVNPSLLIEYIKQNRSNLKNYFNHRNRILNAEKELLDAVNYVGY